MKINTLDDVYNEGDSVPTIQPMRPAMDVDIYDLRRQIDHREQVKEFIKSEIVRYQALLETMTREIISLDLELDRKGKPAGEPTNKRYLYAPDEVLKPRLTDGADNAVDTELA